MLIITLVASTVLVGVALGLLLFRVTNGLVDANTSKSIAEANVGLAAAQQVVLQASESGPPVPGEGLADSIMNALVSSNEGGSFEVLLLDASSPAVTTLPERGTNLVEVASVPAKLRAQVRTEGTEAWTYTTVRSVNQPDEPGLVVGSLLQLGPDAAYEVYYLFPYGELQRALDLVRSTAWLAGVLLVGLLALAMFLVVRHVVMPVRQAARTAELLRAGHLEQRLPVRGEDDLAALASAFNDMAASLQTQIRQLENLSRLQQRFVSDVSHELRTPLTTIRMASDVLYDQREEMPASLRRSSELLRGQLDRFELLLTDLLEISRFDAGAASLEPESVDVRDVVQQAVDAAGPLAVAAGSDLVCEFADRPCVVACDPRRIERIVRNLLSNAIEHGESGPIEVKVAGTEQAVAVSVRDHGRGLDDQDLDRVFDRFWRADPARARTLGGPGLGLSIAMEDTRLHGGRLAVWGRPGQGAVFRLTLPRVPGHELPAESPLPLDPTQVQV
ncbi:MAG: MtrAB system histidine kinase MtrB [Candidatus Nanopelagicales bacterium]|nr:MtrAB system histidine kinase MtrB [Candidatus Nanopelagicales bacterium]